MSESPTPLKHMTVFVSFAKPDELTADYLQNYLNRAGYNTSTFTTSVTPGDRWISSISQSVEGADVVVVLLSKAALESHWVTYEISASVASVESSPKKRIIPVALEKGISPSGILAQYQWIYTSGDLDEVANKVLRALQGPYNIDKEASRRNALDRLIIAQHNLEVDKLGWSAKVAGRDTSRAAGVLYIALLIFAVLIVIAGVGTAIYAFGGQSRSESFLTSLCGLLAALSALIAPLAYTIGRSRIIGRSRPGVSRDKSGK